MDLPQFALGVNQLNSGVTLDETGQSKHPQNMDGPNLVNMAHPPTRMTVIQ